MTAYSFPKDAKDGNEITLENGATYKYEEDKDRWMVLSIGGPAPTGKRKDFIPQLRGSFEIDGDGKAVIPDNAFYISEEDNEDGWKDEIVYPGVWWTGTRYDPKTITHLMVSQSRYVDAVNEDGEYVYDDFSWTKKFYPNDIIRVSASAHEIYHADADGWLDETDHYAQKSDDVWRVKSVLEIAKRDDFSHWGFQAYELEKIIPKDQYSGQWYVGEDEIGDGWSDKYFSVVSVTNHYIEKQPEPFLLFKQKERGAAWSRGVWQGVDGGNYIKQNPKEIAKISFGEMDHLGSDITETTWSAGDTLFLYEEEVEVASFLITDTERVKGSGYSIELTVDPTQTTGDADLNADVYLKTPNPILGVQADCATKEDVEKLQNDIIELEEEIDAIAPSVERGVWKFNLGGVVGSKGQLTMYDGMNGTGSPIGLFKSVKSVWLNELDNDGTPHGFANVNVGDLIELFVQGQSDYGLFTVVEVHDESQGAAQYWVIDVEFVRSLSASSKADNADDVRVKIIQPPSAEGESDSRYLLNGDETDLTGVTRIVADSNKYLSIQSAPNNTQGFFVLRNSGGHNIMHVSDSGRILLKAGHVAKEIDEVTTKRYVDSKVGRAAPTIGRRFVFNRDAGEAIYPGWFGYDGDRFHFCKMDMDSQILVMNGPDFSWSTNIKFTIRDPETGEFVVMGEAHPRTDWNYAVLKLRVPQSVQTDGSGIRYGGISDLVHEKHYNIVVEGYF
jgi:hypothetical protein